MSNDEKVQYHISTIATLIPFFCFKSYKVLSHHEFECNILSFQHAHVKVCTLHAKQQNSVANYTDRARETDRVSETFYFLFF
jgi:hypothetical protein